MNRWLIFSLLVWPLAAAAAVEKLEFVTPAQTVAPGSVSEKITVQTQNAAGASETIGKTADVTFVSSSPTGEFLNESGDPVKTTWNSNWANRSFYYRDSSAGSSTLTVTVTMRDGGPSWTTNQIITIGQAVVEPLPPNPDPDPVPDPEPESPPPAVESPPPPPTVNNQSPPLAVSPATSTMLSNSTTTAPAMLASVPAAAPVPVVPSAPAVPAYAAELARLSSELALAAAKLQTAQKGEQRETKAAEPKTSKTAALEPAATNAIAHDNLAAAAVIEILKPPSFFERLIAIPRRIWSAITNLFRRR